MFVEGNDLNVEQPTMFEDWLHHVFGGRRGAHVEAITDHGIRVNYHSFLSLYRESSGGSALMDPKYEINHERLDWSEIFIYEDPEAEAASELEYWFAIGSHRYFLRESDMSEEHRRFFKKYVSQRKYAFEAIVKHD